MKVNNIRVLLLAVAILTFGNDQSARGQVQTGESADSNKTSVAVPANTVPEAQQQPAAPDTAELAKKLSNPVASLISFPIQTNFDFRMGTGSGWRMTTNIQPVIPIALNKDWNLISRTVAPIIHQGNVTAPGESQTGLGDIVQSIFFSPNKTEPFIWGLGPAVMVPIATNSAFASKQLGLGPTAVVLKQQKGWTVGALWNHIWRVAGGSGRARVNTDFVQPFLAYSTKDGWTYTLNTESTYDWTSNHWSVPIPFRDHEGGQIRETTSEFGGRDAMLGHISRRRRWRLRHSYNRNGYLPEEIIL